MVAQPTAPGVPEERGNPRGRGGKTAAPQSHPLPFGPRGEKGKGEGGGVRTGGKRPRQRAVWSGAGTGLGVTLPWGPLISPLDLLLYSIGGPPVPFSAGTSPSRRAKPGGERRGRPGGRSNVVSRSPWFVQHSSPKIPRPRGGGKGSPRGGLQTPSPNLNLIPCSYRSPFLVLFPVPIPRFVSSPYLYLLCLGPCSTFPLPCSLCCSCECQLVCVRAFIYNFQLLLTPYHFFICDFSTSFLLVICFCALVAIWF